MPLRPAITRCPMSSDTVSSLATLQILALMPAMVTAAVFDVRQRRIPNWLVALIAAAGLLVGWHAGGLHGAGEACVSAGAATLACVPLYVLRGVAGGDVKLVAAGAFWLTLAELMVALAAIALCGALLGAGYLLFARETTHLPYAVAIAGGTGIAVLFF